MVEDHNLDLSGIVGVNNTDADVNHVLGSEARARGYSPIDPYRNGDGEAPS